MTTPLDPAMAAEERLDRVARILAEGFLRHKMRHHRKLASSRDRGEIPLELSCDPRAHAVETRNGEDR